MHKCFLSKDRSILVKAYVTYVRPLLEYAVHVWSCMFMYGHSRNPSSWMRPRNYDVSVPVCVSRPTLCPGVRLWLFMYDICPGNFVTLSQPPYPGVSVPASCPVLPVPGSGNGNSVIKEIKI